MRMAVLENKTKNLTIASQLEIADNFFNRGVGLIGRKSFSPEQGLWIHRCNSVHTCFLNFAIDCVFVDKALKVKAVKKSVNPWRIVLPIWNASSVFELPAGTIHRLQIQEGDQLYVGS